MGGQIITGAATPVEISGTISAATAYPAPAAGQVQKQFGNATATAVTAGSAITAYTVTGGKTMYVTSLHLGNFSGTAMYLKVYDNATIVGSVMMGANTGMCLTFPSPIAFTNTVKIDCSSNGSVVYLGSGWEQ